MLTQVIVAYRDLAIGSPCKVYQPGEELPLDEWAKLTELTKRALINNLRVKPQYRDRVAKVINKALKIGQDVYKSESIIPGNVWDNIPKRVQDALINQHQVKLVDQVRIKGRVKVKTGHKAYEK